MSYEAAGGLTKHELASLCCRVLGLWFLATGVLHVPNVIYWLVGAASSLMQGPDDWTYFMFTGLYMVLCFGMGLYLWFAGPWLARRMLPANGQVFSARRLHLLQVQAIAIGTLGLYFAATGMIGVVMSVLGRSVYLTGVLVDDATLPDWTGTFARLVVGLVLVVGRQRIARALKRIRNIGLSNETP